MAHGVTSSIYKFTGNCKPIWGKIRISDQGIHVSSDALLQSSAQAELSRINGRRPKWKMTSMKDDLNRRQPQWKTTSMEDDLNGR